MSTSSTPLTQADAYGIVVGLGILFAVGMVAATFCLKRYHGEATDSSEGFSTANRTVKTGLIASTVVSSWTWAAILLQSSSVAYSYGISGPFWCASGATVQIILFCVIGIELKRRARFVHTFLITSTLLTGDSAVVHSLPGMHIAAASFLLPLGTIIYTMVGGIKATFLTNYAHNATSPLLGSPSTVYDLLVNASRMHPTEGNADGSYLDMGLQEGTICFAITTSPVSALPGYILGGISWFAVPLLAATTMGLAAVSFDAFGHGLCMEQVVMCLPKGFFTVGINPLVEGRHSISSVTKRMFTDLMSYRRHNIEDVQTKDLTKEASPKLL
ncbi:unnamed protein product [Rotaria magnacalcarata]|uniref:Urea active transporter 1 n=2 Tax=Rotaria magnacalcarata TaxID=392030 RepID=A0A816NJ76_9BILA|nr:unnamed protein product [Rotaria magnacalcarata]CAF3923451.1 unnamed protein product [Rotaria magnacalcarata]CAF3944649.1 unnamed protein product [Rotaria magnacalcarata]